MNIHAKKLALFLCASTFVFGCAKQNEKRAGEGAGAPEAAKKALEAKPVSGVVYVNGAALDDQGKMKWTAEASLGSVATYLGQKKEAVRTDGQKRTFFHVALNDKLYWIQDYCYEPNTVAAFVAAENTILYKSESALGVTDEIMPQFSIVAVYNDERYSGDGMFVRIAAYCPDLAGSSIVKEKFVKRSALEYQNAEVQAMMIAQVAAESRNDIIREELFNNAAASGSAYIDEIESLRALTETVIEEENYIKTLTVEKVSKNVALRDEAELLSVPKFVGARVLTTVKAGAYATASQKTVLTYDSGNASEWYYIKSKQNRGWIAGSELNGL